MNDKGKTLIETPILSFYAEDISIPKKEVTPLDPKINHDPKLIRKGFEFEWKKYEEEAQEYTPQQLIRIIKHLTKEQYNRALWALVEAHHNLT